MFMPISEEFYGYLRGSRSESLVDYIRRRGDGDMEVLDGGKRVRVIFPFNYDKDHKASDYFDRQVDSRQAIMILPGMPYDMPGEEAAKERYKNKLKTLRVGDTIRADELLAKRLFPEIKGISRDVEVTVTRREAYMLTLTFPSGESVLVDQDEMSIWPELFWAGSEEQVDRGLPPDEILTAAKAAAKELGKDVYITSAKVGRLCVTRKWAITLNRDSADSSVVVKPDGQTYQLEVTTS